MRVRRVPFGVLLALSLLGLAACAKPLTMGVQAVDGTRAGTLTLVPPAGFLPPSRSLQAFSGGPYTALSIGYLKLELLDLDSATPDAPIATFNHAPADFATPVVINNLRANGHYRVVTTAYDSNTRGTPKRISTGDSDCWTDVTIASDNAPTVASFRVRLIDDTALSVITLTKGSGPGFDDGPAELATLNAPRGMTPFGKGFLFADTGNHAIRMYAPTGAIVTLAGTGAPGSADGVGTAASFNAPRGVAVRAYTNPWTNATSTWAYVGDTGNHRIRALNLDTLEVTTLAGDGTPGYANGPGNAARFNEPSGLTVGGTTLLVADALNHCIRAVNIAPYNTPPSGFSPAPDASPEANPEYGTVAAWSPALADPAATPSPGLVNANAANSRYREPRDIAYLSIAGVSRWWVADTGNHTIRVCSQSGGIGSAAAWAGPTAGSSPGDVDAAGTAARFNRPEALFVDSGANVYVADTGNHAIRKIPAVGVGSSFGTLSAGPVSTILGPPPPGGPVSGYADGVWMDARCDGPAGLTLLSNNMLCVSDTHNHALRVIR